MNTIKTTDDWSIYNCHIHTFTRKHAPRQFIKWVLSDGDLGRINWIRIPLYLLFVIFYFALLVFLARFAIFLSARSDLFSLLVYSFVLFFQALLVIPIILLFVVLVALGVILLLQGLIDLLIKMRKVTPEGETKDQLLHLKEQVAGGRRRVIRSNLLIDLLVRINPASNDLFERMARFLKISEQPTQEAVFKQVELQYPKDKTVFVVLPMDMGFMKLGKVDEPIESQHEELWKLAQKSATS